VDAENARSLADLEWDRIVAAVTERCVGPAQQRTELPLATTVEGARVACVETSEAWALMDAGEPLPLEGLRDVAVHLARLRRQGALEGPALRDVAMTLASARTLRRFLGRRKDRAPALHRACAFDPTLDDLEVAIRNVIGPDGAIEDDATPDLRRLRTEMANLRGRIVARLEAMIHKHADILQDRYFTLREGRYVLPVRTDAHERLPGIVHATSASGATAFVEPRSLVEQGNRLKMAQGEMAREELRILAALSERVREQVAEVQAAADSLERMDLRNAGARLGRDFGGRVVALSEGPRIVLHAARHPGLLLSGVDVVPSDLRLEGGTALVLSGPNAGGKTVALKTLGLAAWMVRAGLPVPCGDGSECGFFDPILTDVGDEQSIARSLSTFSAHVTHLAAILQKAGRGALVLLDELAGSTDPGEGAALACAVVAHLCEQGAATAVTTHYEALKAMAEQDSRLHNASVGFDMERMEPTFRVQMGVPGASSALLVAGRFGIPEALLTQARRLLPEHTRTFEALVHVLQAKVLEADRERDALADERRRAAQREADAAQRLERLRERASDALDEEVEALRGEVRSARAEVEALRKRLRTEQLDAQRLREAQERLDAAARKVAEAESAAPPPAEVTSLPVAAAGEVAVGDRVWVERLKAEADVVDTSQKGRVRVAAGAMKLWVEVSGLRRVVQDPSRSVAEPEPAPPTGRTAPTTPRDDNTLDVRGLRVDDALSLVETFLDRLYGAAQPVGYIVHGTGTGALRDALRSHLATMGAPVERARPANRTEGGDRVTVVHLR
jgi:DNA mismatch repair protein MutS2